MLELVKIFMYNIDKEHPTTTLTNLKSTIKKKMEAYIPLEENIVHLYALPAAYGHSVHQCHLDCDVFLRIWIG